MTIIGLVLLITIGLGVWLYKDAKDAKTKGSLKAKPENKNSIGIPPNAPPGGSPTWTLGSPDALVTVEEFADFQCPPCAQIQSRVKELRDAFGNRVRIIFRHFPNTDLHPNAYDAACAVEAAGNQGKFWEMQNLLFSNQQSWANATDSRKIFAEYAKTLGLDVNKFNDDLRCLPIKTKVDADIQRGRAIGVDATPTFYINNKPLLRTLSELREAVEEEFARLSNNSVRTNDSKL
jgi:protein-disulfide isomerase